MSRRKKCIICILCCVAATAVYFIFADTNDNVIWDLRPGPGINDPYGGTLQDLVRTGADKERMKDAAIPLNSYQLNDRQLCDIELLLNGAFSPLRGFMNRKTYDSVVQNMKLPDGKVWPMPVTLDVTSKDVKKFAVGEKIALRDSYFNLLAIMTVDDIYSPNREQECELVFGTTDDSHPACHYVLNQGGETYVGGELEGFQLPLHYDFKELRRTPKQLRDVMKEKDWTNVIAYQTHSPMHKAHMEITKRAAGNVGANVLLHPVVGVSQPGDIDYSTRVRCYQAILAPGKEYYPERHVLLSLLPLAMRMAGPREALWHAIIRKNYGATHFIVGIDHAGAKTSEGKSFYAPFAAQELVEKYAPEIGISVQTYHKMVYARSRGEYVPEDEVEETDSLSITGTDFRKRLAGGGEVPEWFADPDAVAILREEYPPYSKRGFTIFFTGLSGSGKTTVSHALIPVLKQHSGRKVTLLDGDRVRTFLSKGLGLSKEDRDTNVLRVAYVASEIAKHGGIAISATIAPYRKARGEARDIIEAEGGAFFEVFQSTPLEFCQQRDPKGLYKQVKEGKIKGFTGIDDPYEPPEHPDIEVDGSKLSVEEGVNKILHYLIDKGYLPPTAVL